MDSLVGQRLGNYQIVAPLGEGGMATVYRAQQLNIRREVAVKVIRPQLAKTSDFIRRFEREAETIAVLDHPHIIKLFDYGHHGDVVYLVTPLLKGGSLADLIRQGILRLPTVSKLLDQICSALEYAHSRGIIHRDLKPQNVLLDEQGNAFLTDFGIATLRTSDHSRSEVGKGFGTPAFMSPEQALGSWEADFRTDIYSVGLVAYRMLAGRLPFTGQSAVSLAAQRTARNAAPLRELAPDVPADLASIVDRCVVREPKGRWKSADALYSAMVRCRSRLLSDGSSSSSFLNRLRAFVVGEVGRHTPTPLPL